MSNRQKKTSKSLNSQFIEQQLKNLLLLLQSHNQTAKQINCVLKDYPSQHSQPSILNENPLEIHKGSSHRRIDSTEFLQQYLDNAKQIGRIFQQTINKCLIILPSFCKEYNQLHQNYVGLLETVEDKNLIILGLQENNLKSQQNLQQITALYDKLLAQKDQLNDQIMDKQQQIETQNKEIRKTFLENQQTNEMEKKVIQNLYESIQTLTQSLNKVSDEKTMFEQDYHKLTSQNQANVSKIQLLEKQLLRKDQHLCCLSSELQSISQKFYEKAKKHKQSFGEQQYPYSIKSKSKEIDIQLDKDKESTIIKPSSSITKQNENKKQQQKNKLSEEITNFENFKIPSYFQVRKSFVDESDCQYDQFNSHASFKTQVLNQQEEKQKEIEIKKSIEIKKERYMQKEQWEKEQFVDRERDAEKQKKIFKKNGTTTGSTFDPYYSHYLLTCQSVKIKQDSQDMLNIDMKPYYRQIIQKRVPMHLWDTWIKNCLSSIENNRKNKKNNDR